MKLWVKLAAALLAIALVPTAALPYLLAREHAAELEQSARDYRLAAADNAMFEVTAFLQQVKRELADIGATISDATQSEARRLANVRSKLASAATLDRVEVFGPDGTYVLGLSAGKAAPPASKTPLAADLRKAAAAHPGALEVREHPRPDDPHLAIGVAISSANGIYGYLQARVSLRPLISRLQELAERRFGRQADNLFVVDRKHRLLVHRDAKRLGTVVSGGLLRGDDPKQLSRNISYGADVGSGADRRLAIIVPVPSVSWGIVVQQRYEVVYASVTATWRRAAMIGGGVALLAILVGLWLGRRMARPVTQLADAAALVALGDFEARVTPRSADEVGALGRSFNSMAGSLAESRDRLLAEARVRGDMSRYLSDALVEAIVSDTRAIELGGKRAKVTILFADVVAFTPLAERHAPEDVVRLLNELFTFLTEIVFKHGGMVDKFIGDCVMAVFGVPEQRENDGEQAALAALEMIEWLETGNAKWSAEFGRELQLGIGISTGTAIVGNLGSTKRMEYTAIGDTVNIAARLEMLAKPGQILISEATRAELGDDFEIEDLGLRDITGRKEQIRIFELREEA